MGKSISDVGKQAREFVDFLEKAGQTYWQILPVCPTSYGDSPYASYSTFAGNPYFIDFELLCEQKLLKSSDYNHIDWGKKPEKVDYHKLSANRKEIKTDKKNRFYMVDDCGKGTKKTLKVLYRMVYNTEFAFDDILNYNNEAWK